MNIEVFLPDWINDMELATTPQNEDDPTGRVFFFAASQMHGRS